MNKKVLLFFVIFSVLVIGFSIFSKLSQKNISLPSPLPSAVLSTPNSSKTIFRDENGQPKYSNGSCTTDSDCVPAGCGNYVCSADPGLITTCIAVSDPPAESGFSCGCANNSCVWAK